MPTLSPPWYGFTNMIKYTYGLSPYIHVNNLIEVNGHYDLIINVYCSVNLASALRQVLPLSKDFGGVILNIVVIDMNGNVVPVNNTAYTNESLAKLFCLALYKNPIFVGSVLTSGKEVPPTMADVVLVIDKHIVQFFNDDISDLCANYNEVAAKTFLEITNLTYAPDLAVSFSTYDPKCQLQKDLYCPTYCKKTHHHCSR